jgi:hypothetical protein
MSPKLAAIANALILLWLSSLDSASSQTPTLTASPNLSSLSPDKKWEYKAPTEEGPKLVKADTDEIAADLSDVCEISSCGDYANVIWAPDSKRFAFNWGQGRTRQTSLYQVRDDQWKALKLPNDDVHEILNKTIKRGLPKKTHLRLIWETVKVHQWVDSNTAILYGGLEVDEAFGAHFLLTLKFDEAGNWKIIKTQRLSLKEAEKL